MQSIWQIWASFFFSQNVATWPVGTVLKYASMSDRTTRQPTGLPVGGTWTPSSRAAWSHRDSRGRSQPVTASSSGWETSGTASARVKRCWVSSLSHPAEREMVRGSGGRGLAKQHEKTNRGRRQGEARRRDVLCELVVLGRAAVPQRHTVTVRLSPCDGLFGPGGPLSLTQTDPDRPVDEGMQRKKEEGFACTLSLTLNSSKLSVYVCVWRGGWKTWLAPGQLSGQRSPANGSAHSGCHQSEHATSDSSPC